MHLAEPQNSPALPAIQQKAVGARNPWRPDLSTRLGVIALAFGVECLTLAQVPHPWFKVQQPAAAPIVFLVALCFFGARRLRLVSPGNANVRHAFLYLHGLSVAGVILGDFLLLRVFLLHSTGRLLTELLWAASLAAVAGTLLLAFIPAHQWKRWVAALGMVWVYAAALTAGAMYLRRAVRLSWDLSESPVGRTLQHMTLGGVKFLLDLFYADVFFDPSTSILGTHRFLVRIGGTCSGIENVSLVLTFTTAWLIYARKELQLARAVALVPVAIGLTWVLNVLRIAVLVVLGNAGYVTFAKNAFHSEAGWILFNLTAIAFLLLASHIRFFHRQPRSE